MSEDVIIGYDGKPRCAWAGGGDTVSVRYHDTVWGTRTYDESALFEALTLGVFEAGLSWSIVFGKRDGFRKAFHDFDVARAAAMTDRDVERLVHDPTIIRNRAKIQATVENARAMRLASAASEPPTTELEARNRDRAVQVSRGWLQAGEDYVVDAVCSSFPVTCRVELPQAGQRENHVVGVEPRTQGAGGDVRLEQAV
jgi:Methyladenine glycosylase